MRSGPLVFTALLSACGPTGEGDTTPSGAPGMGNNVNAGQDTKPPTCGGMQFAIERVPPNVLLVLDRSGSMREPISDFSSSSKFDDLQAALQSLVMQFDSQMRLGLDLFPDPQGAPCQGGRIVIPPGQGNGAQILSAVSQSGLSQSTPTAATLDTVIQSHALADPARTNYVVLATDGQPTCDDQDVTSRINALYTATPSVRTFVIGVGSETSSDPQLLNEWAMAGRTARFGMTQYYQSNSPMDLQQAFSAIAGGLASCTFRMAQPASDPTQLYVWSNGAQVPADANAGFTYDASGPSVTLHGAACDQLQQNPSTKIQVVFGCPSPPIQ
jgi:hypothetical protein